MSLTVPSTGLPSQAFLIALVIAFPALTETLRMVNFGGKTGVTKIRTGSPANPAPSWTLYQCRFLGRLSFFPDRDAPAFLTPGNEKLT